MSNDSPRQEDTRTHGSEWLILAALAVILLLQLAMSVREWSVTSDEMDHLHAGYRYLTCGDFGWNPEHPPLLKMVAALPLLGTRINDPIPNACGMPNSKSIDFHAGHDFIFANPERVLSAARAASALFVLGLLVVVWVAARRMFGLATAVTASVLLVFEPNILAHGALVTTDIPATFGFLAAVIALYWYFERRTGINLIILGVATGIALMLKHSCILLAPAFVALTLLDPLVVASTDEPRARRIARNLGELVVVGLIAFAMLWMSYGLRYAARPNGAKAWVNQSVQDSTGVVAIRIIPALKNRHLLPESYLNGLQDILVESEVVKRPAFLLGQLYRGGRWSYFPVAALIKFSAVVLVFALSACFAFRFWSTKRRELLFLVLPPSIFLAASLTSGMNIGIRHILPVLPFLILFGAAGVLALVARSRKAQVVCAAAIFLHAASSLHAFPNYISYSNEFWGGTENTYKYLADSNADWGQAMKQAKTYVDRNHPKSCWIIHLYNLSSDYGIPCGDTSSLKPDAPPDHFSGTLIVSSSVIDGTVDYLGGRRTAAIFRGRQPKAKLGGSALLVYEGDFNLSGFSAYSHAIRSTQALSYNVPLAMREAEQAIALDPQNYLAHLVLCASSSETGNMDRAERECNATLQCIHADPSSGADSGGVTTFMVSHGIRLYRP